MQGPFDVSDDLLSQELHQEYDKMLREDMAKRIRPVAAQFAALRYEVEQYDLLPALTASLPARAIEQLAKRPDVRAIYLNDGEPVPSLDSAVPTNRVYPVWEDGVDGGQFGKNGRIRIAIMEDENVDRDNSYLHHAPLRLVGIDGEGNHATHVASAAASFHDRLGGMAPESEILSAGANDTVPGVLASLEWALDPPYLNGGNADIVNYSNSVYENSSELEWLDRAFDYAARKREATIIVAAGNHPSDYLPSPAKAWNVITVGGTDDKNNADWTDDEMYASSSYLDDPALDREKPEIVAPAQSLDLIGVNDQLDANRNGTSLAAPQVAGLTALLMHRDPAVRGYPTAIKAILMASAVHNIEGDSTLSDKDGAGAINARLADEIVQTHGDNGVTCNQPCWWGVDTTSSYPAPEDFLYQYFNATQGERIRVAIAWWSDADSPRPYLPPPWTPPLADDILATNYNLYVWKPSGGDAVGYSAWWNNNYEIVEFTAPETGQYKIGVYKQPTPSEDANTVGIAWTKLSTFFPDVRDGYDGWYSNIWRRNDGAEPRAIRRTIFNDDGSVDSFSQGFIYQPRQESYGWGNNITGIGSATINANENSSTLVESWHVGDEIGMAYTGIAIPTTEVYLPGVWRADTVRSLITVKNTSAQSASLDMDYYDESAGYQGTHTSSLSGGAQYTFDPFNCDDASPICNQIFAGGVKIAADQPIAVVATTQWYDGFNNRIRSSQYSGVPKGQTELYGPSIFRTCEYYTGTTTCKPGDPWAWGLISAVRLQNVSDQWAYAKLKFIPRADTDPASPCKNNTLTVYDWNPSGHSHGFNTRGGGWKATGWKQSQKDNNLFVPLGANGCTDWKGTVEIESLNGEPLVGMNNTIWINGSRSGSHTLFGPEDARTAVVLPKQFLSTTGIWTRGWSRIQAMNIGSSSTNIWVTYYDAFGRVKYTTGNYSLGSKEAVGLNTSTLKTNDTNFPEPYEGSAIVISDGEAIIVTTDLMYTDDDPQGKNRAATYEGVGR